MSGLDMAVGVFLVSVVIIFLWIIISADKGGEDDTDR